MKFLRLWSGRYCNCRKAAPRLLAPFGSVENIRPIKQGKSCSQDDSANMQRIPIADIFNNERSYLFSTTKNMRSYEWDREECETFFADIRDSFDQTALSNDVELNQVIIIQEKKDTTGTMYQVHDGQQRIVTLCLLLSALRDSLRVSLTEDDVDYSKHLENYLYIKSRNKSVPKVMRVQLRNKDSEEFNKIITGNITDLPQTSKKPVGKKILDNYQYFCDELKSMRTQSGGLEKFGDHILNNVYFLITEPSNGMIARRLVAGQNKGKNSGTIDEFKAIVVFGGISDEELCDKYLAKWDAIMGDDDARKLLSETCLMMAQAAMKKKAKKNQEVSLLEDFYRSVSRKGEVDGAIFFDQYLEPGFDCWDRIIKGNLHLVGPASDQPSLTFLTLAMKAGCGAQEIGIVILDMALRRVRDGDDKKLTRQLRRLERVALYMMLSAEKPDYRYKRYWKILHELESDGEATTSLDLSVEECRICFEKLDKSDLDSKRATAILFRMNEHRLIKESQARVTPDKQASNALTIEHVLPQTVTPKSAPKWIEAWPVQGDRDVWTNKLGNLALLNGGKNSALGNKAYLDKKEALHSSPFPLTRRMGMHEQWTIQTVQQNHKEIVTSACEIWDLA